MDDQNARRVLIVGWDGATFDLITPWAKAGYLPITARLLAEGARRTLNSTIPTLSPPAWTSFFTGKNPGRHGIFDFIRRRAGTYELQSVRNRLPSLGTLFHWAGQGGKRVGVINVPFTYPPEHVNGFMVSGLSAALEWEFTYPFELRDELLAQGYRIDNPIYYQGDNDQAYVEAALAITRKRAEVALHLLKTREWDLGMVVFTNIDQLLSFGWHHMDSTHPRHDPALAYLGNSVLELHQFLDTVLGQMMELAGEDTTVILGSDHGMGPLYKEVFLNNWLREKGYLVMRRAPRAAQGYRRFMRHLGVSREGIWRWLGRARTQRLKGMLPDRFHGLIPTEHPSLAEQIDWAKTKAYSFGNVGQVYVNLVGREPQGTVKPGQEYVDLVTELTCDLYDLTDPETGERLVDVVYRKEDLYDGPYLDAAPDLNIIMKNYSYITQMRRELAHCELVRPSLNMSGFHRREGIFVAAGPSIRPGEYSPGSITDVTPTVLYLMALAIPDDMDGQVMSDIFAPAFRKRFPVQRRAVVNGLTSRVPDIELNGREEEQVLRRLRELGYLD